MMVLGQGGNPMRTVPFAVAAAALVAGCVTTETVQFRPTATQQALIRDGQPAIVSRLKNSIVLVRPALRQFQPGARPIFVVAMYNLTNAPLEFRVGNVEVTQLVNGQPAALKVVTYEQLVSEEHDRQVLRALGAGLAVAGNSMAAANAGYYHSNSTVYTPRGAFQVNTTGYSPTAAAIAQSNANAQNEALISATIEKGQANMATLEHGVIKDNTLMPGEWYGGQLHIQPLVSDNGSGTKTYQIVVNVGPDRHEINIAQGSGPEAGT
jgi:hypothetical protein